MKSALCETYRGAYSPAAFFDELIGVSIGGEISAHMFKSTTGV